MSLERRPVAGSGRRIVFDRVALALAAGIAALLPPPASAVPRIVHHDLEVSLHPDNGTLSATDTLTFRPVGAEPISLVLSGGAIVSRLAVDGRDLSPIPKPFPDGSISVPIPPGSRAGTVPVAIAYEAAFRDPVPEEPASMDDPGHGVRGAITPRGTFLSGAAGWYPRLPGSASTFRVRVVAPAGVEAVTAGRLLRRGTEGGRAFSEWEVARPTENLALSAGRYVVRESAAGKVPVYTCFSRNNDHLSEKYHAAVAGYLGLYEGLFGPYPFEKFAVVENFFSTGYGFPSWTLLGSRVVGLPFIPETSLGHEIAHSWWGNGVLVDDDRGNWSEGLTTYVADHLFRERESAEEGRAYRLRLLRDYAALVPGEKDFPLRAFGARVDPATRAVGYGKAAMVFHMARRVVGEEIFWAALRDLAREKFGRAASWGDFDRAFARRGGPDLSPFFSQWVDRPGAPRVALRDVESRRETGGWKVAGRLVQEKPHYEIEVFLRLVAEGETADAAIPLIGEDVRFALWSAKRPLKLIVDPEVDLFRRLDPSEIPPSVNGIKGSPSLLVVAARRLSPDLLEAAKVLLPAMGHGGAAILPEEELDPARIKGRDVLFLGLPAGKGLLPPLPDGLEMSEASFRLNGRKYDAPGDALFAALPHPAEPGRVAAVFLPLSPRAASAAAGKISHFGEYSYLAFAEGTNREKGTWEPPAAPTTHVFPAEKDR